MAVYVPNSTDANRVSGDRDGQQHRDGFGCRGECTFRRGLSAACLCSLFGKGVQWYLQRDLQRQYSSVEGPDCRFVAGGVTENVVVTGGNFPFANGLIGGSVAIAGASTFSLGPGTPSTEAWGLDSGSRDHGTRSVASKCSRFRSGWRRRPLQIGSASPATCAGHTIGGNATLDVNTAAIGLYEQYGNRNPKLPGQQIHNGWSKHGQEQTGPVQSILRLLRAGNNTTGINAPRIAGKWGRPGSPALTV